MSEPAAPVQTTEKVSAVDAAVIASGDSLSDGVTEFLHARNAERLGKPKEAVEIKVEKAPDGTVTPVDPKLVRKEQRLAKQQEINEGARKAAGRIVEDYDAKIAKLEAELAAARQGPPPAGSVATVQPLAAVPAPPAADDPAPNVADEAKYPGGEYDPKYIKDAAKWEFRQEQRARDAQAEADRQAAAKTQDWQRAEAALATDIAAAPKELQDAIFKSETPVSFGGQTMTFGQFLGQFIPLENVAKMQAAKTLPANYQTTTLNILASYVVRSPQRLALLKHFAETPSEMGRILTEGTPALHRLEGQLAAGASSSAPLAALPAPAPNTITRAPAPPDTLGSRVTSPADPVAAAVKEGQGGLTEGVRSYRAARLQERLAAQGRR